MPSPIAKCLYWCFFVSRGFFRFILAASPCLLKLRRIISTLTSIPSALSSFTIAVAVPFSGFYSKRSTVRSSCSLKRWGRHELTLSYTFSAPIYRPRIPWIVLRGISNCWGFPVLRCLARAMQWPPIVGAESSSSWHFPYRFSNFPCSSNTVESVYRQGSKFHNKSMLKFLASTFPRWSSSLSTALQLLFVASSTCSSHLLH
jgi:hypothetical protein